MAGLGWDCFPAMHRCVLSFTGVNSFQQEARNAVQQGPAIHLYPLFNAPSTTIWYPALPAIIILLCLRPLALIDVIDFNKQQASEEDDDDDNDDEDVTVQREAGSLLAFKD